MAQKPRSPRKKHRPTEARIETTAAAPSLAPDVEQRLREEFEALIQRMQSPDSATAYDALSNMSGQDIRDFFKTPQGQRTKAKAQSPTEAPRMEAYDDVFDALHSDDPVKAAAMKLRSDAMMKASGAAPKAGHRRNRPSTRLPPSED